MRQANQFQTEAMRLLLDKIDVLDHQLMVAKRELQQVCTHLLPNGSSARVTNTRSFTPCILCGEMYG